MNSRVILILCLVSLVVLFIIQNVVVVEIRFLLWSLEMSRSLLIFMVLAMGMLIGWFLHGYISHKKTERES